MEKQDLILKEKNIKWTADAKFAATYICIYKNDNSHYLTKQKGEKYIYRKHIHWLKLIKGRWKRPDSIWKFITSLIMSSFKEIVFFLWITV